jgi:hypothetical protein
VLRDIAAEKRGVMRADRARRLSEGMDAVWRGYLRSSYTTN